MANQRMKKAGRDAIHPGSTGDSAQTRRTPLSRGKLWSFRVLALIGAPLLCVGLLELVLWLAGFGYPTTFLQSVRHQNQEGYVPNNQFGWRFFGPQMARLPEPFFIARQKAPGTIRIFMFGESAAKGEPQPTFGPARMLRTILSERHPGARFEVVNVAMTAINSHAILPIARDCVSAGGEIWVIYTGNNEVVGPFGAGTVFSQQTPPLWLIRSTLALKSTRTGQLFETLMGSKVTAMPDGSEWRGMKMFLEQQVRADDARMKSVYDHFRCNLTDIIRTGQRAGAGIVVSTVAVNLRNCAPFASLHRAGLSAPELDVWEKAYQLGLQAHASGKVAEAAQHFREAAGIDDTFAELRFCQGQCALALGEASAAREHFAAARDLDTLRFRCDSRLNELIRQAAGNREGEHILLADAEKDFAATSLEALPGTELFYEHVHPTFEGNFLLATTLARQVERLLPTNLIATVKTAWPTKADCARRLGWSDWGQLAALQDIFARIKSPPFTAQINHNIQVRQLAARLEELSPGLQPTGLAMARIAVEEALTLSPDDAALHGQLAAIQQASGDITGAIVSARRGLELVPSNPAAWLQLGVLLVRQQKMDEAASAFQHALELNPADVIARQNLAQSLWLKGKREEAIAQYQKLLSLQSNFGVAWISLGQALEASGRKSEAADCYQRALAARSTRASDLVTLARFCRSRGWRDAAATNYSAALGVSPGDAALCMEAGQNLIVLRRNTEALAVFAEAARLAPSSAQAQHLYGTALGQEGRAIEAEQQFREALRLEPKLLEARLNLGIALMSQGRNAESLECLEEVLQVSPTNELAFKYVQRLRAGDGR